MTTAYIGLGSNMGDRMANLSRAIDAVAHLPETHVEDISHAYRSQAAYNEAQDDFFNAVISVTTGLRADSLLAYLLDIEEAMGRVRAEENGPRVIDMDLLLFGDEEWNSDKLTLPHPLLAERDFVVRPLLEIAPHVRMPDGSRLHRDRATVGPIIADEGVIPDFGTEHERPVDADVWVAVAETEWTADSLMGFDASLQLKATALREAGIPVGFDPYEPGAEVDPFVQRSTFRLLVPMEFAQQAADIAQMVGDAPPDIPGDTDVPRRGMGEA